jgi:hypothetical protein
MSKHRSIVDAIKAAEECGHGHGEFWKNWMVDDLGHAHRRNEIFAGCHSKDSRVMLNSEYQRGYFGPKERVYFNDHLWDSSDD